MGAEEAVARKRYQALMQVRAKAVKGKGAWYRGHLEPLLVPPPGSGAPPNAARLRCALCASTFSASNPSRTAIEHLKRSACPNFASPHPPQMQQQQQRCHSTDGGGARKRHALAAAYAAVDASSQQQHVVVMSEPAAAYSPTPLPALPTSSPRLQALSGGRSDLSALAWLEDSVKRLKYYSEAGQFLYLGPPPPAATGTW